MDVTPLIKVGQQVIQSYTKGKFKVSGSIYDTAVIVTPSETLIWPESPTLIENLTEHNFQTLLDMTEQVDVVLLGCGETIKFLPFDLKKSLKDKGLSVDVMDTGAACRTYNVLMAEGRRVAAALIPTDA